MDRSDRDDFDGLGTLRRRLGLRRLVVCRAAALADTVTISITTTGNRTPEL